MRAERIMQSKCCTEATCRGNPPWLPPATGRAQGPAPTCTHGVLLILFLAGVALSAQPQTRKPLPETTVLDAVDGRIVHVDANDTWFFELAADANTVTARVPAGTRFVLLPSAVLARLIADVNDRAEPRYRLSARATLYQGKNYLLPTYYLPLSKFKSAGGGEPKAEDAVKPQPSDPNLTVPEEIIKQLQNARPPRGPQRKDGEAGDPNAQSASRQPQSAERMLVDRVGLIEAEDDHFVFIPYALGWNVSDERYELLPSSILEQVQRQQAGSLEVIRWNVAGLVTEFRGKKYLLLQRAVPVYNYGDFGRS
jgi:hypothetical protein